MSRAALLPTPGDPFILTYWIKKFREVWQGEVDRLYVCLNMYPHIAEKVLDYDMKMLTQMDKVEVVYVPKMLYHGKALRQLVAYCEEDLLMFIEDDAIVFRPGAIDRAFRMIEKEEAGIVGSPRFSCSQQILDASAEKYGLDYSGYGDKGPNMWPCFFFARREDMLKTNQHYESKGWKKGEYIPELGVTAEDELAGDTFVWVSMQLRAMGLEFAEVPQGHSHPDDMEFYEKGEGIWDPLNPWVHIGSLTMTAETLLTEDRPEALGKMETGMEKREAMRRFAWLLLFVEETREETEELKPLRDIYVRRINDIIKKAGLSMTHINNLKAAYKQLMA